MNRTPPPASPQQRAAPAQQHPAAVPVPGAARMPSAAPLQAAGGSQQAVPAGISATAIQPQSSPQNLGIDPVAANDNDSRFGFEWKSRAIGSNHTWGCVVSAAEGEAISVRVAQLPYDRTLRGVGAVEVIAIPVAPVGTRGTLMARNESTGAVAEFNWTWSPFKPRFTAARPKTVPSGKPPPPTGGVAAAPSAKAATERQAITTGAPTQAEQIGVVGAAALQARTGRTSARQAFFGMQAVGGRVAFVLDMSGSMAGSRWEKCKQELTGILSSLEERDQFYVVLFSDRLEVPPDQAGWMPAEPQRTAAVISWIEGIWPDGGTCPRPAFELLYSLAVRPTTVFFLTDGQFWDLTPEVCAQLENARPPSEGGGPVSRLLGRLFGADEKSGRERAAINTITLDEAASAPVMQKIAADSGGQYTHASSQ